MGIDNLLKYIENEQTASLVEMAYWFFLDRCGSEKIESVLGVVSTLVEFHADADTLVGAMLHRCFEYGVSTGEIEELFGKRIAHIASGAFLLQWSYSFTAEERDISLGNLRLDSEVDVRSLFVILASRFRDLERLSAEAKGSKVIAKDTLNVLVPVAKRMKLNYIRSRLEDECIRIMHPEEYKAILDNLGSSPNVLKKYLKDFEPEIYGVLMRGGIKSKIRFRVKSVYSIYNKLAGGKTWEDLKDILAIRVLVDRPEDCYKALEIIHSRYSVVLGHFKDYIAQPKKNMYQSLHTLIMTEDGHMIEVQIRTFEMEKVAATSHDAYKDSQKKIDV